MSFGLRSGERAATTLVRQRSGGATTLPALLATLAALALLAGCGGGGGGGGGGGNNNSNTATVTGTVVDPNTSNSPDTDVVVALVGTTNYAITSSTGTFSLNIPSGTAGSVIFYGKVARDSSGNVVKGSNGLPTSVSTNDSNTYSGPGYYPASSKTEVNLFSTGVPVAAQSGGATVNIGTVGLFTLNDPPLPPSGF